MLICSLNWTSSDTTGHGTGLGTGLSLARGSSDCFDFAAASLFDGMSDFVEGWRDNDIWCHNLANCPPRGVLWYFHTYVGSGNFTGFKILNFNIFWSFQKNEYLLGIKISWIFFGGHHNIGLYLGVISMHFRVFFKVKVQNGEYFFSCYIKFLIFWGCLKFLIFFGGER